MALVNGPLFSLSAAGQIGKAIVYSSWKGRDYVREYVVPANPRSLAQQFQRGILGALSKWWASIALADREEWSGLAALGNYSTFNAFTKYNLELEGANELIEAWPEPDGDAPSDVVDTVTGLGSTGALQVTVALTGATAATDLLMVSIGTASGAVGTSQTIQRTMAARANSTSADDFIANFTDIPAGDYFLSSRVVGQDGTATAWTGSASAITVS